MKVVSNSSPLIFLSAIGMLDLLKDEFGEILVPEAVYDEVTSNELKGSDEVKDADWIKVQTIKNIEVLSFLPMLGLNVMGTLGFLKVMHHKGRIENFKDVLDDLQKNGFWMAADLCKRMLEE